MSVLSCHPERSEGSLLLARRANRKDSSLPLRMTTVGIIASSLLLLIRIYQSTVGPALPASCRFQPTCSRYAYTAIERHGALRGTWLSLRRLARCQPFGGSGYDPVP
jgi:putative membrane protein insertion efficiency factor